MSFNQKHVIQSKIRSLTKKCHVWSHLIDACIWSLLMWIMLNTYIPSLNCNNALALHSYGTDSTFWSSLLHTYQQAYVHHQVWTDSYDWSKCDLLQHGSSAVHACQTPKSLFCKVSWMSFQPCTTPWMLAGCRNACCLKTLKNENHGSLSHPLLSALPNVYKSCFLHHLHGMTLRIFCTVMSIPLLSAVTSIFWHHKCEILRHPYIFTCFRDVKCLHNVAHILCCQTCNALYALEIATTHGRPKFSYLQVYQSLCPSQ